VQAINGAFGIDRFQAFEREGWAVPAADTMKAQSTGLTTWAIGKGVRTPSVWIIRA